jgi:myo-inositol-1(or 4)-monophosphatase
MDSVDPVETVDTAALMSLCRDTAVDVGAELIAWRGKHRDLQVSTKSSPTDVVTDADRLAESWIQERLLAVWPQSRWWGEESGRSPEAGSGSVLEWVVDPIDGTVNFLYDLPGWAVSIAARYQGEVVASAVAMPRYDEVAYARHGAGAWITDANGERTLAVTHCTQLELALIATGFAYDAEVRKAQGRAVGAMIGRVRDIRRAGAASIDLCSVALGRVDAFFEWGLAPWDRAAGVLIAREAGAYVEELADGSVLASTPALVESLRELLVESGGWK